MTDIVIEKFSDEYIKILAELEKICFSVPWSEAGLAAELTNSYARFFVAKINGKIVGYIGAHNVLGEVYITNVAVFPNYRKKGVATELIKKLINTAFDENSDFVTLEVRKSNRSAIELYEKNGFIMVGERKKFYENPTEDAILMTYYLRKQDEDI